MWWCGGQVVRERWRGGLLHLPGRAGGSCSWNSWPGSRLHASGFFLPFFPFFFSFPFPFHHLFAQTVPAAPVTLILPVLPHLLQLGAAWGRLGPHGQLLGREEGARHRSGRDWVPRWSGLRGSWGESKNRFFFNGQLLQSEGGAGEDDMPPPPSCSLTRWQPLPAQLATAGRAGLRPQPERLASLSL